MTPDQPEQPPRKRRRRRRTISGDYRPYRSPRARALARFKGMAIFLAALVIVGGGLFLFLADVPEPDVVAAEAPATARPKPRERTAALPPLNLPADEAPHGSAMEWWYYSGILDANAGQRFGFHMVVFVANGLVKHTVMHAALTDLQSGKRYVSQTRTAGSPMTSIPNGFDFRQDGWQATASASAHALRATFDQAAVTLTLNNGGPLVAHRAPGSETPGLLDFGSSGISYYYSRPRLPTRGEIVIGGKPTPVRGEVWFDHQWGEFDVLSLGWNWFALQLADGSDLMLYELFDKNGRSVVTAGTISDAKGSQPLEQGQAELVPGARWTSPKTNITYVVEWNIKLPTGVLHVKPYLPDSEFDSGGTTANVYWEGPVKVSGSREGRGFLELSGYDRLGLKPTKSP
ncbi:lipocalin family protein [Variovorax sp. KK3]|uniref:lipocalin family protein n=1 Tax=Variovorax sp. KK3 TaxID=1855728 RepID=UPI00097C2F64|nr:lipocalin family protein [Variovorax sp. KK3]